MVAMNVWPTDAADGSVANEARWRKMGRLWAVSGVAAGQGGEMAPSLAGTNLTIRSGAAWVDGHYCELLGDQVLTTTANGMAVVRFDPAANTAELLYRDGVTTPIQTPTGTWELPIAQIIGSALTDKRGPLVNPGGDVTVGTIRSGTIPSGTVNPATESTVATITLPVGRHLVSYVSLLTSNAGMNCTFKLFNFGSLIFNYRIVSADAQGSFAFTVPVTVTGGSVTVVLNNAGTQAIVTYPDPLYHSLSAMQGRS